MKQPSPRQVRKLDHKSQGALLRELRNQHTIEEVCDWIRQPGGYGSCDSFCLLPFQRAEREKARLVFLGLLAAIPFPFGTY